MTQSLEQSGDDGSQTTGQPPAADNVDRDTRATVAIAVIAGLIAVALVSVWTVTQPLADHALTLSTGWYYLGFLLLAIGAEIVYVPLRHGDTHEELTFFEILLLIGVLIFPPVLALTIPLIGYALAGVILRVDLRKLLFNLGSYAVSSSILILVYGLFSDPTAQFSAQSILALLLGAALFASVNLGMLAWILNVDQGVPVKEFLRQEWVLSAIMAIGSVGVAATVVALATYTPVLAPFVLLPAAALWYAYRSSAAQSESAERNRWIVDFTAAVAEPGTQDEVVPAVAHALRQVFNADDIRVVLAHTTYASSTPGARLAPTPRTSADAEIARLGEAGPTPIPAALLPPNWNSGVLVTITLAGPDTGAVLLGGTETINSVQSALPWARGAWRLQDVDAPVFQALSTAFASALRASENLMALIEESAKLSTVVDYASDGIAVLDPAGSIQMWSPAMVSITGISAEAALGTLPRVERSTTIAEGTGDAQILMHFQSLALAAAVASADASVGVDVGPRTHHELDLPIQRADGSERDLNLAVAWIAEDG
ncbi:MAG: PAS domain-containing protein, partial [Actinomycetia bacterium]|nr:PAS domain-containing protein [Actinomycetes bacterium]